MDIRRFDLTQPPGPRMSRCVVRGDTVYLAGLTANDASQDIKGQTQQILDKIDGYLAQAGTSKSNLLTANLWIKDMALFADMNAVWNAWVDPGKPAGARLRQGRFGAPADPRRNHGHRRQIAFGRAASGEFRRGCVRRLGLGVGRPGGGDDYRPAIRRGCPPGRIAVRADLGARRPGAARRAYAGPRRRLRRSPRAAPGGDRRRHPARRFAAAHDRGAARRDALGQRRETRGDARDRRRKTAQDARGTARRQLQIGQRTARAGVQERRRDAVAGGRRRRSEAGAEQRQKPRHLGRSLVGRHPRSGADRRAVWPQRRSSPGQRAARRIRHPPARRGWRRPAVAADRRQIPDRGLRAAARRRRPCRRRRGRGGRQGDRGPGAAGGARHQQQIRRAAAFDRFCAAVSADRGALCRDRAASRSGRSFAARLARRHCRTDDPAGAAEQSAHGVSQPGHPTAVERSLAGLARGQDRVRQIWRDARPGAEKAAGGLDDDRGRRHPSPPDRPPPCRRRDIAGARGRPAARLRRRRALRRRSRSDATAQPAVAPIRVPSSACAGRCGNRARPARPRRGRDCRGRRSSPG